MLPVKWRGSIVTAADDGSNLCLSTRAAADRCLWSFKISCLSLVTAYFQRHSASAVLPSQNCPIAELVPRPRRKPLLRWARREMFYKTSLTTRLHYVHAAGEISSIVITTAGQSAPLKGLSEKTEPSKVMGFGPSSGGPPHQGGLLHRAHQDLGRVAGETHWTRWTWTF